MSISIIVLSYFVNIIADKKKPCCVFVGFLKSVGIYYIRNIRATFTCERPGVNVAFSQLLHREKGVIIIIDFVIAKNKSSRFLFYYRCNVVGNYDTRTGLDSVTKHFIYLLLITI